MSNLELSEKAKRRLSRKRLPSKTLTTVRIIGFNNQKGLTKDIEILTKELSLLGIKVEFLETQEKISGSTTQKLYGFAKAIVQHKFPSRRKEGISIFLERIVPELLDKSRINLLIPNPEWFHPAWRFFSGNIDATLCKTKHAIDIYKSLGFKTQYLGFTSPDKGFDNAFQKEPCFLHVAGGSLFKGTAKLVSVWEKHPEWPQLTVITHRVMANCTTSASNISILNQFVDEEVLLALQNRTLFHIYPSQAEGFGHCINEAMSCGAIVLTNGAAPMNELVTTQEGFLFDCYPQGSNCLSDLFDFDEDSFVHQVNTAICETTHKQQLRCKAARKAYEVRDHCFKANLRSVVLECLATL